MPGPEPATRHLLAVTAADEPGGAETTLLRLLARLRGRGWDVTVTTPGDGAMREAALAAGHAWRSLPVGGLAAGAGARAVSAWPAVRRLAAASPDGVVYLNGTVTGRLLPALAGAHVRRVLHVHDTVGRVPAFWRLADVVLAASDATAQALAPLPSHVVYGPVDADPPPEPAPWPLGGGPVVGFVGRIEPRKGPLDLVRAAPAIRRGRPDARIMVIGDDRYGTDPAYTAAVIDSAEIEHHAWVANAPGLMRHLDVLVLPSYQEPFGTVLAEAMAVGTPVVATRVGGLAEVVRDGVTGRLVSPPGIHRPSPRRCWRCSLIVTGWAPPPGTGHDGSTPTGMPNASSASSRETDSRETDHGRRTCARRARSRRSSVQAGALSPNGGRPRAETGARARRRIA